MRFKAFFSAALVALVVAALIAPTGVAAAKGGKGKSQLTAVSTDADNDWGTNADPALAGFGEHLGQELIGGAIGMADKKTVNFVFQMKALPPWGGWPEFSRYTWDFTVGKETFEIDGKFTNYSRGACDPTSGQCPPPRDPGMQPFLVRGKCHVEALQVTNFTICEEVAKVQGVFDAAAGTITVPVPLAAIGAKPGSKIGPGQGTFGAPISAAPAVFATFDNWPMDTAQVTKTFVVPRGKKK